MKKIFFISLFLFSFINLTFADSPLTSTEFYKAYSTYPIVIEAASTKGILTNSLVTYLTNDENPIDVKIAIINTLGWDIKGKSNAKIFIEYCSKKYNSKNYQQLTKELNASELICLAYIKSLDDYFNVKEANKLALLAIEKSPNSYTIRIIQSLINAQSYVMKSYCKVFKIIEEVKLNKTLIMDFKKEASEIIFQYINDYKKYCKL
jgi:hypothetical protein